MFGTPQKGKVTRPALAGKGPAAIKKKPNFDVNDTSIEGTLKQVLDEQDLLNEARDPQIVADDLAGIDAPLVRLVNSLLAEAVKMNCSDIHIEPFESMLRIRYRVDGNLREIQKVPHKLANSITTRLKVMAELDICERRIPQDGSFKFKGHGIEADFRLSTLPSVFGEKAVLRVMGSANVNNDLSKLGIPANQLKLIREAINKPDGLVLVTGPTGSGKTTTLYAALNELNDITVSVFTAEDPVEGNLPGVTQCAVNASVGYTFASILRAFLRQDPDVILVGEIRDQETAEISIKAALTGHLVLSTLHTNCSVSTISRLVNMGVAPYLITSSVNCVVAQRLVRKVCESCKHEFSPPPELLERLGPGAELLQGAKLVHGKGCPSCFNSGYRGRAPIYEVLVLNDELRRLILAGASREDLRRCALAQKMISLREAGLELVRQGITTLEEVLGATNQDNESEGNVAASAVPEASVPAQPVMHTHASPVQSRAETVIFEAPSVPPPQTQISPTPAQELSKPAAPSSGPAPASRWVKRGSEPASA